MKILLKKIPQKELYNFIKSEKDKRKLKVYIGLDVGKDVLDVAVTISNTSFQVYLGTVNNTASGFKQIEDVVIRLLELGIDRDNIFFATENTGIYSHDVMDFFDCKLPHTYILNSTLTYKARKFYAKADYKTDGLDAMVVAMVLSDLDNKGKLETNSNPYKKNKVGIGFVRKSYSKELGSLRILFRRLAKLRREKGELMTSINHSKYRLFPELSGIFTIKHRAVSESILLNNFTRKEILKMTKADFLNKYKSLATSNQRNKLILAKVEKFYDRIIERGEKTARSELDIITKKYSDTYILDEINHKFKYYNLVIEEMSIVSSKISDLVLILKENGFFIPSFVGISDIELAIFLSEFGDGIYDVSKKEMIGFIGWHPNNFTSGGDKTTKQSELSSKKTIIKKYVYIWMYGFSLHNPSFRLYKNLLKMLYGIEKEKKSTTNTKNKRKIEIKAGQKLLMIIWKCFQISGKFKEKVFVKHTILPLIEKLKSNGFDNDTINGTIKETYKTKTIPDNLILE